MAKHQIFLVHGMGQFEPNWGLDIKALLNEKFDAYAGAKARGGAANFDFVPITYDGVFESWRTQWRQDAAAAATAAQKLGLDGGTASQLIKLAQAPTGDSFFQTHVLDVVMFRFLNQVCEEGKQQLRKQILARLQSFPQNDPPVGWSVIAHSLGTAVIHDTLHAMFTEGLPDSGLRLGDAFKPDLLMMVANTGKLLWNQGGNFYASEVHPRVVGTPGVCWHYMNVRHELDPVPMPDPFDPPPAWFPAGVPPDEVFTPIMLPAKDTQQVNVHAFAHYLSHPDVHIPLISYLFSRPDIVSAAEHEAALADWRSKSLANQALSQAKQQLAAFESNPNDTWAQVMQRLVDFRTLLKSIGLDPRDGES